MRHVANAIALFIGLTLVGPSLTPDPPIPAPATYRCEEDMPCWDCTTHGNGICGLTPSEDAAERAESLTHNGQELPRTS